MFFLGLFSGNSSNKPKPGGVPVPSTGSRVAKADPFEEQRRQDRQDISRFLDGDGEGFERLMNRYRNRAYGIALNLTGNHDDAMDAAQKAFIRIHRSLGKFRLEEPFFPWLYRIVRNTAHNQRRDEKRHKGEVPLEWIKQLDGRADPLSETVAGDLLARIWNGLQELPEEMREVFSLYHFEGLKYREIAEAKGLPLGTVMSRLHAARLKLRAVADLEDEL